MLAFSRASITRLKQIGKLRLYRAGLDADKPWSAIAPVISARPINWELIAQHYDELVRYATALSCTAEAQQLFWRFVRGGPRRPRPPGTR